MTTMPTTKTKRRKEYADYDDDGGGGGGGDGGPDSSQARKLSNSTEHCVHNKVGVDLDEGCWLQACEPAQNLLNRDQAEEREGSRLSGLGPGSRIFGCGPSRGRHQHRVSVGSLGRLPRTRSLQ